MAKSLYDTLGVAKGAKADEIKKAYRKLARENHPDRNPGDAAAEARFKEVQAAYDVLSDPEKRKQYDTFGAENGRRRPGAGNADFGDLNFGGDFNLGDLFGGLFDRFRGPNGGGASGPQRGDDVEAELHLSFLDAMNGVTTTVNVTSEAACGTCHGTGAAPGTTPVVCPRCGGRGVMAENQGLFSFSRACPECGGRGMKVETPCPTCRGTGVEVRPRQVKVRIPPGVSDGQRIRVKGRGGAGRGDGPTGDLWVTVRVAPHQLFKRKGRDLLLTVPITFAEAALGAEITVPTLEGGDTTGSVVLRVPPGTRSGRTFRVKGRGVPGAKGTGDLLVTVEVTVPSKLSDAERKAVEALAAATKESPRTHLGV